LIKIPLSLRLCIWTEYGPVGARLERGAPLPQYQQSYTDTPEGREQAMQDMEFLQRYIETNQQKKKRK